MKTLISRQWLHGILQSRCPQDGISERDERPEKREERHRTARATAARPRGWPFARKCKYLQSYWTYPNNPNINTEHLSRTTIFQKSERRDAETSEI
ncbi:hypothetical protein M404DRAFT_1001832 [Pisolithus tinctorius Marx 270]|uniref:Uncharacterized protein n=1 Tax=Pisolithus tinctorius Marx 270 TaxID=870435 RepID=A0A0C3NPY1_PISTI|nr:hypothetical protein M404DRAFT_1001832 [Pisolithus tinctorius Marx 270]